MDSLVTTLNKQGWLVWNLGQREGHWICTLASHTMQSGVIEQESRAKGGYQGGFSKQGRGATPAEAIADAASDFMTPKKKEEISSPSLDQMLGFR